jgi:hypothetical protein
VAFGAEFVIGSDFMVIAAIGKRRESVDINSDTATNSLSNGCLRWWIGRHFHLGGHASTLFGLEEVDDILSSEGQGCEAMVVNCSDEQWFGKVAVLQVDGLDDFDIEALWFGEVNLIGVVEMDGSSESIGKEGDTVRDSSVWVEKMRRKFEDEVLSKNCVGDEITVGRMDSLVDNIMNPWKSEGVAVAEEPPHGEKCAGSFLTVIDTINRGR